MTAPDLDVLIIGAGPVGLTLANQLGAAGVRTLVVEQLDELIDYPRGVGLDDESLRVFQGIGLVREVRAHTVPDHAIHWVTSNGHVLATMKPTERLYGWPRRNGFIQPLVDRALLKGLERYPSVTVRFGTSVTEVVEAEGAVRVTLHGHAGAPSSTTASWLVGCDGGKSLVRKTMDVEFAGNTEPTQWIVVDMADDPVGTPSVFAVSDARFPYVSVGLPGGVRRFEFMVPRAETEASLRASGAMERNIARVLGDVPPLNVIRSRVYTHHARVASSFRRQRMFLAGDAAHLMPVWQGQGYNTGIRDAANLGWKLVLVVQGRCDARLLDTYDEERRPHATAMVKLSEAAGRILVPRTKLHEVVRNAAISLARRLPSLRKYLLEMRYKPMPFFRTGAVVHEARPAAPSAVGRLMIQPNVADARGDVVLLDELLGRGFSLLSWGRHPQRYLDEAARRLLRDLDVNLLVCIPPCQAFERADEPDGAALVLDHDGKLQTWFDAHGCATVLIRPDRIVALACRPMDLSQRLRDFARVLACREKPPPAEPLPVDVPNPSKETA